MTIGKTLKSFRLRLGLNQAEMAEDILTPSYYSKIERSAHRISAEDLFNILNKHSINITEFTNAFYLSQSQDSHLFSLINDEINLYHYQENIEKLRQIPGRVNQNNNKLTDFESQLLLSLNESVIYGLTGDEADLSKGSVQFLKRQFFEAEDWNDFKLTLYTNIMSMYDFHANHSIIGSLLNKDLSEFKAEHQIYILNILINFISICLLNDALFLAKHYNELILTAPTNYNNVFQKIIAKYHHYIFIYLDDPSLENETNALEFINVFKEIDFGIHNQAIELFHNTKRRYTAE